jgi:hypothetical protein
MAGNTFIQVPSDITNTVTLRRFLEKLSLQVDTAFSKRGTNGFITGLSIEELVSTISELERDISNIQSSITSLISEINDGTPVVNVYTNYIATANTEFLVCKNSSDITITLPSAISMFSNNKTKELTVTVVGEGNVNITSRDLILGEPSQTLYSGEVLNLISDGSTWYLGA